MPALTKTQTGTDWLPEKLREAENTGLVQKTIANVDGEPKIRRKNRVPKINSSLK